MLPPLSSLSPQNQGSEDGQHLDQRCWGGQARRLWDCQGDDGGQRHGQDHDRHPILPQPRDLRRQAVQQEERRVGPWMCLIRAGHPQVHLFYELPYMLLLQSFPAINIDRRALILCSQASVRGRDSSSHCPQDREGQLPSRPHLLLSAVQGIDSKHSHPKPRRQTGGSLPPPSTL